jgi:hypothetical protein
MESLQVQHPFVYQAWSKQIWDQTRLAPYVPFEGHHADELAVPPGSAFGFGCAGRCRL